MPMKQALATALALTLAAAAPAASAADDPARRQDLAAVIALQGQPCGEVVSYEAHGKDDFVATCKDGNRYRVFVNDRGRVVVEKR